MSTINAAKMLENAVNIMRKKLSYHTVFVELL